MVLVHYLYKKQNAVDERAEEKKEVSVFYITKQEPGKSCRLMSVPSVYPNHIFMW